MLARQFATRWVGLASPIGKHSYTSKYTEGGLVVSPNEDNRRSDAFRKMLAAAPKPGTNTIPITHFPNIIAALGKDWFERQRRPSHNLPAGERQLQACRLRADGRMAPHRDGSQVAQAGRASMDDLRS